MCKYVITVFPFRMEKPSLKQGTEYKVSQGVLGRTMKPLRKKRFLTLLNKW